MHTFSEVADMCRVPCPWSPGYTELEFLFTKVREYNPRSIVEIGTGPGGGTCVLHFAAPMAMLYTYDLSANLDCFDGKPPGYIAMPYVSDNVLFHYRSTSADLRAMVDFAYIDGDHRHAETFTDFLCCLLRARFPYTCAFHDIGLDSKYPERRPEYGATRLWEILNYLQPRCGYELHKYDSMGLVHIAKECNIYNLLVALILGLEETAPGQGKRLLDIHDYKV